jgi:NCAIR mutase (PurE)-related protein
LYREKLVKAKPHKHRKESRVHRDALRKLLEDLKAGSVSVDEVLRRLETLPFADLGFARLDAHRWLRCGLPEVIFGQNKTPQQVEEIFSRLAEQGGNVLATRVSAEAARRVLARFPQAQYHELAQMVTLRQRHGLLSRGTVGVVCAGTSDLPVAEEARVTLEMLDQRTATFYDIGVAGLHRLLADLERLRAARVLIVVAGMEGALPSVVGGLVAAPVIAVPTSVGYGASFGGLAALLAMLNSCVPGISVVNIDNGFGAACQAALINRLGEPEQPHCGPQKDSAGE